MRSAAVLAPILLPLITATLITIMGALGITVGRVAVATGAWSSLISLSAAWIPLRSIQDVALGPLGFGSSFNVRIDSVAFAFGLMIIVPAALLFTFQRRTWQESAIGMLALTAAVAAIEAGDMVLTAIAGASAATLALVLLETEDPKAPRPSWAALLAGWLALAWVGVLLQVRGGTAVYDAVPVSVLTPAVFALLAASALVVSGLFPWRGWPVRMWSRPQLGAAGISLATLYPLGFYVLVRAYEIGDGHYPGPAFNVTLAAIGALVAFGAGMRAQAAPTRREFFGDAVQSFGGLALMSIAIGTPLGAPLEGYTFEGFRNADGSVGTRNLLAVTTTVQCVSGVVDHAVRRVREELLPRYPNFDDVVARAWKAGKDAFMHGYYDIADHTALLEDIERRRGEPVDISCYVNDRRGPD